MKLSKSISGSLAGAVTLAAACSVNAQTQFSIAYDNAYQGIVSVAGSGFSEDVYLTPFQASYVSGAALPFPTSNPFITFCIDIAPNLQTSGTWIAGTFPTGNPPTPPAQSGAPQIPYVNGGIQEAASIYNAYVGNVDISSSSGQLWGAALQVAIWSDLYGSAFSLTSDGHDLTAVNNLVSTILASSHNIADPSLTSTFWNAVDPVVNQDLIGPQMETGFVPETGTYAAAASACAFLGLMVVRQNQKRK